MPLSRGTLSYHRNDLDHALERGQRGIELVYCERRRAPDMPIQLDTLRLAIAELNAAIEGLEALLKREEG